jgi:hypothetical protein
MIITRGYGSNSLIITRGYGTSIRIILSIIPELIFRRVSIVKVFSRVAVKKIFRREDV